MIVNPVDMGYNSNCEFLLSEVIFEKVFSTVLKRRRVNIRGRVQGVGFRPSVHRIAVSLGLAGWVVNDMQGVVIEVQGDECQIEEFLRRIKRADKPVMAKISEVKTQDIEPVEGERGFVIGLSESEGQPFSQVSPDTAVCGECLAEMGDKEDFRYRYAFINCVNCGPRYSIVKSIPYDRSNTTMSGFRMCPKCQEQYTDVGDRRFHAQPVACPKCGPTIWFAESSGQVLEGDNEFVIAKAVEMLNDGKIVAVKGIGGFHLMVDAKNQQAVERLRERKQRDAKPFAMMAESVETVRRYAKVTPEAEKVLVSPESPIVLLEKEPGCGLADSVAKGVGSYGFMLCYAPLHYLLFEQGLEVLVATSGNISEQPLICKNDEAVEKLGGVADGFLMHNREIYRQVDDSIVHMVDGEAVILRRSRGYVPGSILMNETVGGDILATGADMKNAFCLVKGDQFIMSEHMGDLGDAEVYRHYEGSVEHLAELFEVNPEVVVCDLHPGYFSTQYAKKQEGVELVQVQHHWAHIASVLAENDMKGPVIGLECDGTGYGTDGKIWGCECMIASLEDFSRFGHLEYFPLAGGDKASKEAVRPMMGLLKEAYGEEFSVEGFSDILERVESDNRVWEVIDKQIDRGLNCVETSSLGRVFDAVAGIVGMGGYNDFDAQLPMALEAEIEKGIKGNYSVEILEDDNGLVLMGVSGMLRKIVEDVRGGVKSGIISAKFHNGVGEGLCSMAEVAREDSGISTVALSGGVFCNQYLIGSMIRGLKKRGFKVLFNKVVPSNDGGISLGQAAIASEYYKLNNEFRREDK